MLSDCSKIANTQNIRKDSQQKLMDEVALISLKTVKDH